MRSGGTGANWLAANGSSLWVSNNLSNSITRINTRTRKRVATVKVGLGPVNLDVVNGDVWVPCDQDKTLWRVSGKTNKMGEKLSASGNPAVVAPVEGEVWATIFDAGSVWRIRPE